jgi:hypothetical protein
LEEGLMTTRWTVTIDCAHPAELAAFWSLALGYVEASPPAGFASVHSGYQDVLPGIWHPSSLVG